MRNLPNVVLHLPMWGKSSSMTFLSYIIARTMFLPVTVFYVCNLRFHTIFSSSLSLPIKLVLFLMKILQTVLQPLKLIPSSLLQFSSTIHLSLSSSILISPYRYPSNAPPPFALSFCAPPLYGGGPPFCPIAWIIVSPTINNDAASNQFAYFVAPDFQHRGGIKNGGHKFDMYICFL